MFSEEEYIILLPKACAFPYSLARSEPPVGLFSQKFGPPVYGAFTQRTGGGANRFAASARRPHTVDFAGGVRLQRVLG